MESDAAIFSLVAGEALWCLQDPVYESVTLFSPSEPSLLRWLIQGENEKGEELWSARISDRYVLAPFSVAHPHNDETQPLTYYVTTDKRPLIEAPVSLIEFLKQKAAKKIAKVATDSDKTIVTEGGRNNWLTSMAGKARQTASMNEDELLTYLRRLNSEQCQPSLPDAEVQAIARSVAGYEVKQSDLVMNQAAPAAALSTEVALSIPEIDTSEVASRPVFPYWALEGTSLYEGLVKPAIASSSKHAEFIAMPAIQTMMNYVSGRVRIGQHTNCGFRGMVINDSRTIVIAIPG